MDAGKIFGAVGNDLEDIVGGPGHQVAFKDFGNPLHLGLEGIEDFIRLALQFDLYEYG